MIISCVNLGRYKINIPYHCSKLPRVQSSQQMSIRIFYTSKNDQKQVEIWQVECFFSRKLIHSHNSLFFFSEIQVRALNEQEVVIAWNSAVQVTFQSENLVIFLRSDSICKPGQSCSADTLLSNFGGHQLFG